MSNIHIWGATVLLFLLILAPTLSYLCLGWNVRRSDIVEGFSNTAIQSYFRAFHPQVPDNENWHRRFNNYYKSQFGRLRFILPLILFAGIAGLLLCWSTLSIPDLLQSAEIPPGKLPALAIVAMLGAYMWILFDQITRWSSSNISPGDLYWWSFRFVIAIPMGYALTRLFTRDLAMPLAFLLGSFPTVQLMSISRRIATRKFGFADSENREISELQSLQGIDIKKAEQFAAEGITTILQLAYSDPIRLTIRTGLNYSYIVDCTCQGLLWIYAEKDIAVLRASGLRSAYEVLSLCLNLEDPNEKDRAEQVVREAARAVKIPESSLRNVLSEVAKDPFSVFLYLSWSGMAIDDFNEGQQRILGLQSS